MIPAILIPFIPVFVQLAESVLAPKADQSDFGAQKKAWVMGSLTFMWDALARHGALPAAVLSEKDAVIGLLDAAVEAAVAKL